MGAAGADEVERHVGGPTDVLMRKAPIRTLVAPTHHTLTHEACSSHHKHEQNDGNDWPNGVGGFITGNEA